MGVCTIDGCEKKRDSRAWCGMHYKRWKRHGDPEFKPEIPTCAVEGCDGAHRARGWCNMHWKRWRKYGDPEADVQLQVPDDAPFSARLDARVDRSGDCWLWTGSTDSGGYGHLDMGGRKVQAHRASYEEFVGPIPEGLEVDHLCSVRNCVNPEHLEPVTRLENVRRSFARAAIDQEDTDG